MDDFWQLETFTFDVFHFLNIFQLLFIINVNKKFLQIALLEPTPYIVNMPVSFLFR